MNASDPDGNALTYRLTSAPAGMTIDARGRITWAPVHLRHRPRIRSRWKSPTPSALPASQSFDLSVSGRHASHRMSSRTSASLRRTWVRRSSSSCPRQIMSASWTWRLTVDGTPLPWTAMGVRSSMLSRSGHSTWRPGPRTRRATSHGHDDTLGHRSERCGCARRGDH